MSEASAGVGMYNFYRLNGPYDPDTAVLSAATPGLSNMAQWYRSMRVWNVRVRMTGSASVGGGDAPAILACLVPTAFQPVLPSACENWPVQRLARAVPVHITGSTGGGAPFGSFPFVVEKQFSLSQVANITQDQYRDEADYASLTNGTPTRQLYVAVAVATNGAYTMSVRSFVTISYDIEFFDPYPIQ